MRVGDRLIHLLAVPLARGVFRLIAATQRIEYEGLEHYTAATATGRPLIFAFWHEDLAGIIIAHLRLQRRRPVAVMISRSRDGDLLARLLSPLNVVPVRASSSRGGVRGLVELTRWLQAGTEPPPMAAAALDGPRGPRRQAKAGVAMLARKAGALVLPMTFRSRRPMVFRSWDRTRLPMPGAVTRIVFAPPLSAIEWGGNDMLGTKQIVDRLNGITGQDLP